ncbi:hypothetical protein LIER_37870 [Lithospermum erythrorhizon]|uniref:Legume lectin domain-containing protein n=1 Tax=Lithospermum erythrorhizon TaxID=34254 RepID=A0AAV3PRP0_LITER
MKLQLRDLLLLLHQIISFHPIVGLTNAKTDGNISNKFIGIELDTFKQWVDPDGNHIGIDINSVKSVKTESLSKHGIDIAPIGPNFFNFWVQYNGSSKILDLNSQLNSVRRWNLTFANLDDSASKSGKIF